MRIKIHNVGRIGVIQDIPAHELPPEAWTDAENVRMYDGAVWKAFGHLRVMDPPSIDPYSLVPAYSAAGNQLFAYPGFIKVFATDGDAHADITRTVGGNYTGDDTNLWNGGNIGGVLILNNGKDLPQAWIGPSLAVKLVNLPNWPVTDTARVIRPYKRFLVATDIQKSGTRFPQLVKWSDRCEPGTVPGSWDIGDPTKRAGEWPLIDSDGAIVDQLPLGGVNFIYKEDEIHSMTEIAGNYVFQFERRFAQVGLLAQRCVKVYQKQDQLVHVMMTPEDIVQHDGFQMTSLLDDKLRRWYKGRNDPTKATRCWLTPNYSEEEVWAGIVEAGHQYPNMVLIINMKDGTTTMQEIPDISHIAWAAFDPGAGSTTFDSQLIEFNQMVGQFGQRLFSPGRKRLLMVDPAGPRFLLADQGFTHDGDNYPARIERQGLAMIGRDRQGNPKVDTEVSKMVTEIWPRVRMVNGHTVYISVGSQEKLESPVNWSGPFPYMPAFSDKVDVDPPACGRFIAVKFETFDDDAVWKLDGYDLEMNILGKYWP